jgi:hypothetical protein
MDVLEIALDYFTDFKKFEILATEIMTLEGFGTIVPIGGVDDDGIDAEVVKYFGNKIEKLIFQFTIQETITSKITDTVKKLKEKNIDFQQLIIVTKHQINNIQKHKTDARVKHKVHLEIFGKDIFIKHLSTNPGMVARYFPDLKSQINSSLFDRKSIFSNSNDDLELSLLKCSLLFTFNPKSDGARKDIFDHTILGLIVNEQKDITKEKIVQIFKKKFDKEIPVSEVEATLLRLKKDGYISNDNSIIQPTKLAIEKIEGSLSKINLSTQALIDDIISNTKDIFEEKIDKRNEGIIANNIKQSLSAYFRLYGVEYSDGILLPEAKGLKNNEDLISLAKKGLNNKLGDLVVYAIGEVLKAPTPNQIDTLASWAKAFVGLQIMGLDPKLSEFQATSISQKTFILDTDFLLDSIVLENKLSSVFLKLIEKLHKLRCTIIIPEEAILEAVKHAEHAHRVYSYFKNIIGTVDSLIVEEKMQNVFVKGYYNAVLSNGLDSSEISFKGYLENYYDKDRPIAFLKDLINNTFRGTVTIKEISTLLEKPLPFDKLEELTLKIFEETKYTIKGGYRTEEENREVAATDAKLFLTTYYSNQQKEKSTNDILNGTHYLITSSNRTIRCAKKLGHTSNVVTKPNTIINLLEKIGQFSATSSEIVNLFENPYLIDAVNNSWETIKALSNAGIVLRGKNIVRLRWDLDNEIKNFIAEQSKMDENEQILDSQKVDNYILFIRKIKSKGYKLIPDVELLESKVAELEEEVKTNSKIQESLQNEIEKFGKKRQQYFDKINTKKRK